MSENNKKVARLAPPETRSLYGDWAALRLQPTRPAFLAMLQGLRSKWKTPKTLAIWTTMEELYGFDGKVAPVDTWARYETAGCPSTNMSLERMNRTAKGIVGPSLRFDTMLAHLGKVDKYFEKKAALLAAGVRCERIVKRPAKLFEQCHPTDPQDYSIERQSNSEEFLVKKKKDGQWSHLYKVRRNWAHCTEELCKVRCAFCHKEAHCAHVYACTCPSFMNRNRCKHQHLVHAHLLQEGEGEDEPAGAVQGASNDNIASSCELGPEPGKLYA